MKRGKTGNKRKKKTAEDLSATHDDNACCMRCWAFWG